MKTESTSLKITVVTVCYNAVGEIEETILSVIGQTYPNVEYIVIDGGSTDGTIDIIKRYEDRITRWISEPDKGIYDAMNKGIRLATGDYINFMNAGDRFFDKKVLEDVFESLPADMSVDVIYGSWVSKHKDGCISVHPVLARLRYQMALGHQSVFVKKSLIALNPFDTSYKLTADFNMLHSFYIQNHTFYYCKKYIAIYDMGGASASLKNEKRIYQEIQKIIGNPYSETRYLVTHIWRRIKHLLYPFIPTIILDRFRGRKDGATKRIPISTISQL